MLEQSNCFSGTKTDVSVGFVAICGIQIIEEKLGLTFSGKFVRCFIEIQYPVMKRSH